MRVDARGFLGGVQAVPEGVSCCTLRCGDLQMGKKSKAEKKLKKAEKKAAKKAAKSGGDKVDRRDVKPEFDRLP